MVEPEPVCSRGDSLAEATDSLHDAGTQALPVVDDYERYRGILRADALALALLREPDGAHRRVVADLVESTPEPCGREADLAGALDAMRRQHTDVLPVVDDYGVLCGLVRLSEVAEAVLHADAWWRVRAPARDAVLAALAAATDPVTSVAAPRRG